MKVSLRKSEKTTGLFTKTTEYELWVKVELRPEEREAIKKLGIDEYLLMEYWYRGSRIDWKVASVLYASDRNSENRFVASDAVERSKMETHVKEQLVALKSQIDEHKAAESGPQAETFEL